MRRAAMSDCKIYLGMPGYGKQTAQAGRGFWRASRNMDHVTNEYRNGSLLASNFNQLWCGALNLVHSGGQVDYFAMLHDDIGPDDYWLDTLIEELESNDLDLLGVVVPIKDSRGVTSIALDRPGDHWMAHSRLTMHDVFALPETFTSEDIGLPILLNSGCWVCRFDLSWAKKVHFAVNDRIVFNRAANRYQSQTESEDWFFSRLCHEIGLKIGATRKVHVVHQGDMMFSNARPWGTDPYDREYTDRSAVPGAFPHDVRGWLLPEEGAELARLANGKRVLEIGSYAGLSTICMARTALHVTCVDYWDGRATGSPCNTLEEFKSNIKRHKVEQKIAIRYPSDILPYQQYDMIFVDGSHEEDDVYTDLVYAADMLAPDGIIVAHDYRPVQAGSLICDPGVLAAVDRFVSHGAKLTHEIGSLAVIKPAQHLMEV